MAKLPILKRILREDVKEAPSWIEKLLYPINTFFDSVYSSLNKGLTFSDNILCQIKEIDFTTSASYDGTSANFVPLSFLSTMKNTRAQGLLLLQITQKAGNYTPIEGDVYIDWLDLNGSIQINLVRGLNASTTYKLRVLVI